MANDTIDNDKQFRQLMGQMEIMATGPHVDVGFFAGAKAESGEGDPVSVAEYMYINEVGTFDIPARPVMAQTGDIERNGSTGALVASESVAVASGKASVERALTLIGIHYKGQLQKAIHAFSSPANAPATIEKKGANNPLVDTGTAANAITFEVKDAKKPAKKRRRRS